MERTKESIIRTFSQLLDERPYNKITVKDIVERCGISRNTFYYHFQDIPALLQEIMDNLADKLIAEHYNPGSPIDCLKPMLQYALDHRRACLHLYRYVPRERLFSQLRQSIQKMVDCYMVNIFAGTDAKSADVDLLAYLYRCAMTGVMLDWLESGMKEDILPTAERLCHLLEGAGEQLLQVIHTPPAADGKGGSTPPPPAKT